MGGVPHGRKLQRRNRLDGGHYGEATEQAHEGGIIAKWGEGAAKSNRQAAIANREPHTRHVRRQHIFAAGP
jgi:hypothetical protein